MSMPRSFALLFLLLACCLAGGWRVAEVYDLATARPKPFDFDEERDAWLLAQRAYPFAIIPDGARHAAFASMHRTLRADALTSSSSLRWETFGPSPLHVAWKNWQSSNGRVIALAISPSDPNLVLAGASCGGVLRSVDGGITFEAVSDDQADLSVGAIAFAPSNPQIAYAAMGSDFLGTGVLRSSDTGATWTRVTNDATFPQRGTSRRILIDPNDSEHVLVAQYSQQVATGSIFASGLLESRDGGRSFHTLFSGLIEDLVRVPGDSGTLLMALSRVDRIPGATPGIYRSSDGGATWTQVFTGPFDTTQSIVARLAVHATAPGTVYAIAQGMVSGAAARHLFKSTNSGTTWSEVLSTTLPDRDARFLTATDERTLYLGTTDLFRSTDGGASWTNVSNNYRNDGSFHPDQAIFHCDQHAVAVSGSMVYAANDGGIVRSSDGGATFTAAGGDVSLVEFYSIAAHPLDPLVVVGGTQDNGLTRRGDGTKSWSELLTGDYGPVLFNPNDPSMFFSNYVYGTIYRLTRAGLSATRVASNATFAEPADAPRIAFIAPLAMTRNGSLYFGTWRLFTSPDLGATWSAPAGMTDLTKGSRDVLTTIASSADDPNTIYTGSLRGRAMVTRDGGTNWTDVTAGLPDRSITRIVASPDGATAYVTMSGYGMPHVFRTSNYGASWTNISGNLPDIPVNTIFVDPANAGVLYAGTDIGAFRSDNGGVSWQVLAGMPPVVVNAFTRMVDGRIVAGTYGRGAYVLTTPEGPRRRVARH